MVRERKKGADKFFLVVVCILIALGLMMFISASLGVLAKDQKTFYSVLSSQIGLGFGLGLLALYLTSKINYKIWRRYAFFILLASLILTALVFLPTLGVSHQGAERWVKLGPISFQPAEILKIGFIIYFAAWLAWAKSRIQSFKWSILPLFLLLGLVGLLLLKQPDTKSFILITGTGIAMIFFAGVPIRHIILSVLAATLVLGALVSVTPYLQSRVKTFIDPSQDVRGSSYQIQQSLIAIGSGGIWGRGYGQSVQKFSYLPEPQGDSIFAVWGEELGFLGTVTIIILFLFFALRGIRIANHTPDLFGRLLAFGIVILITMQAFMHIASITGVFPLTGVPLPFMSHGGTSLLALLAGTGIVLNISKQKS